MREARAIHPRAAAVFAALDEARVNWCLLRGEDRLEQPPHDVDLLVAPGDVGAFTAAVRPLGFFPVPTWARGSHRFFVAYVPAGDHWLVLDVVTELAFGPGYAVRTRAAAGMLARRERLGPVAVAAEDDAFWALLLHCLVDRGEVGPRQAAALRRLAPGAGTRSELAQVAAGTAAAHLRDAAMEAPEDLPRLRRQMLRRHWRQDPVRYAARSLADWVAWRVAPVHTRVAIRRLRVGLVGDRADVRALTARLREGFYAPARDRLALIPARADPAERYDLLLRVGPGFSRPQATEAIWRTLVARCGWADA